jgi:hypothetical protein
VSGRSEVRPEPGATGDARLPPVSIVTVARDGFFFSRLLVEKVRALVGPREYEIIVVDRGSRDGSRAWMARQTDVVLIKYSHWWTRDHGHAEAAERAIRIARFERIVLLDSDAHPVDAGWLAGTADRLDDHTRLAGATFVDRHKGNPHGWYIHPHFMTFFRADYGSLITLRKLQGHDTDTGEEATMRVLAAGKGIIRHPLTFAADLSVGHDRVPTIAGGVFHAWYVTRLEHHEAHVIRETGGQVSVTSYMRPLQERLRQHYNLDY